MRKQIEAANQIKSFLSNQGLDIKPGKITLPDGQQWIVLGAALGRIAMLDKPDGKKLVPVEWLK